MTPQPDRGQVLVLFALMLVVLLGFAALAIDVTDVLSEMRMERGVADAAALAGASDAYRQGSNNVGAPEYRNARTHAMQNLMDELSPTFVAGDLLLGVLPTCSGQAPPYNNDVVNCPVAGTPFYVSIYAPAPSCAAGGCDPVRSVQVTVRNPHHGLTFARLFAQTQWNLAVTSVAERNRGTNYSFVTLRPPKPRTNPNNPTDQNEDDVGLDGSNTTLIVRGDMGTNTNMILTNGSTVSLPDTGSVVDRYDAYKGWTGAPADRPIPQPVPDPNYAIPATVPNDVAHAAITYTNAAAARMTIPDCKTEVAKIPASYNSRLVVPINAPGVDNGSIICLKPGRYTYNGGVGGYNASVKTLIFTSSVTFGVYFLEKGLHPGNNMQIVGGYEPGVPGVALVFQNRCNPGCEFSGNALDRLVLNAGAAYPSGTGTPATAAVNWDGSIVQTTGRVPVAMTLIVRKNPACYVALIDPCDVSVSQWRQLTLPGGSNSVVFGVQYAPTDNVFITGGSGSDGLLGQIWAWTVKYSGGTHITLIGANNPEPGVLRIATPCSPRAACTNPEATVVIP